jgi:hypothetical protein
MSEPIVSLDMQAAAWIAIVGSWAVAALVTFIVITLRNASLGRRVSKLCGGYARAVQIIHAVAEKRKERQAQPTRERPTLRVVRR